MRRLLVVVTAFGLLLAACAEDEPTVGGDETGPTAPTGTTETTGPTGTTAEATAASCAEENVDALKSPGTLTIGTGNPAFPPWWEGGESDG
ncbi:MAG: hypothetical protein ACXWYN_09780, partial [Actinomycetota bacterium]